MDSLHLLVIGDPKAAHLRHLARLPEGTEVTIGRTAGELRAAAPQADAVLVTTGRGNVLSELWPGLQRLRWVHSLATGVENVLFPDLIASSIPLTNSRGVFAESLGEFAIAAILFFAKNLRRMLHNQQEARWEPFDVDEISRQSIGIVGYGEIGRAAARRAHALGMEVHALRRRAALSDGDPIVSRSYTTEQRIEMLSQVDYIVAAAPLTPETRGLVGHDEIRAMKPNAVLINLGRGPVVDEVALIAALQEERIRGAALDVFDEEPLPEAHPFWRMKNVLLSPHTADHTKTWLDEAMEFLLANVQRFRAGEPLENVVDKKAGY